MTSAWLALLVALTGVTGLRVPAPARRTVVGGSLALCGTLLPSCARAAEELDVPAPESTPPPASKPSDMTYEELKSRLIECKNSEFCMIEKVAFRSASGDQAVVIFKSGETLPVIGIPAEDPSSDSSPARLVARLRDAKVPFTFPFSEYLAKSQAR